MPEQKHTPAPWSYDEESGEIWTTNKMEDPAYPVGSVRLVTGCYEAADGRLIAAAPDTLQRLKESVAWLREVAKDFRLAKQDALAAGCELRAYNGQAAIDKAIGK